MLAVIRARFPGVPPTEHWSDAVMQSWLDPNIPFSLAHFMTRTSFHQLDMRYVLFPPLAVEDKRGDASLGADGRERLVRSVLNVVSQTVNPDWDLFDQFLICFAGQVDMFGGGSYILPTREGSDRQFITGAVIDALSPFDALCQEVGHGFGLDHELGRTGAEYACPYSPMSAQGQGSSFVRPTDSRLPVGKPPAADGPYKGMTNDVQRIIGPYIPAVHFYVKTPGFVHPDSVYRVPLSYEQAPHTFRLEALDRGVSSWPQRRRVLAVLPSSRGGDEFFLEVRRPVDYDQGIVSDPSNTGRVPAGIVVYSYSTVTKRVTYLDRIPFNHPAGDRDFHSYKGFFAVRLNSFDDDLGAANLTVGGGDFWKHFGVDINAQESTELVSSTDWATAHVAACFVFPARDYLYRYQFTETTVSLQATSLGFEQPNYRWFLDDVELDPGRSSIGLVLSVKRAKDAQLLPPKDETVNFEYTLIQGRLTLRTRTPVADINAKVRVVVNESSPEVLKSFYPEQSGWTNVNLDNLKVHWDDAHTRDLAQCWKSFTLVETPVFKVEKPDPGPRFEDITLEVIVQRLAMTNPAAAVAVLNEVSRLTLGAPLDVGRLGKRVNG